MTAPADTYGRPSTRATPEPPRPIAKRGTIAFTAAAAQAAAFTAAAVLVFLCTDIAAEFTASSASRWWPLGAFALAMTLAANATRRTGDLARARYTGALALGGLTLGSLALALAPTFWFAVVAAGATGAVAGLVVAIAGRVLAAVEYGDGSASVALSTAALLTGIVAGTGALFLLPLYGWRGVFGLVVVAGAFAAWKFAELVPIHAVRKRTDT